MIARSTETSTAAREETKLEELTCQVNKTDPDKLLKLEQVGQASSNSIEDLVDPEDNELSALRLKISTSVLQLGLADASMTAKESLLRQLGNRWSGCPF
jgi:hypothetical protein